MNDLVYKFVRGQGWVLGPDYIDPNYTIPIVDMRTDWSSPWCKFQVRSLKGEYDGKWVDEYAFRRWSDLEKLKKLVENYSHLHEWESRIVLIDPDDWCREKL